jgi:voltage-gated potassium channel Kch
MRLLRSLPFIGSLLALWDDPEARALLVIAASQITLGTFVFWLIEDWSIVDSFYFCVVTATTIGYGDFTPTTEAGRLVCVVYILLSVGLFVALLSRIATGRVERRAVAIETRREQRATGTREP